jgi:hypothetical protein
LYYQVITGSPLVKISSSTSIWLGICMLILFSVFVFFLAIEHATFLP